MSDRNTLRVEGDRLVVVPRGLDRVWGFRRRVVVPLGSIADVRVESSPRSIPTGWRGPGLDVFWKLSGTFHPAGERHFWNYAAPGGVLSIRLDGSQHFDALHLSVDDADTWRRRLAALIAAAA